MENLVPTASDDAKRAQLVNNLWWTAGDLLLGTDTTARIDPAQLRTDGLQGSPGSAYSYGVGMDGEVYVRGRSGTTGTSEQASPTVAAGAGLQLSPGFMMLALLAFFLIRKT